MIRILIVTHGELASALKTSSKMFFGEMSDSLETIGLFPTDSPDSLQVKIKEKINEIDDGSGVLIFVDIFAGSPFNNVAIVLDELKEDHKLQCFTGVNMPLLMEALASCQTMDIESLTDHLEKVSKDTIVNLRKALDI
uniref:PTS system mannose-specific transporter subunit IIAB n=1 Tax=Faecalicoccus pleomorphus TaxID=1323 RepID=A0A380LLD8_9FIRM|nr:PTS sugar transporter subunit IIA [Faecalicoccus pleomorphus]SUO04704.1 PTS system mannose-specific transporter subunit IIAB [Faecalicoccus pleomorphus]